MLWDKGSARMPWHWRDILFHSHSWWWRNTLPVKTVGLQESLWLKILYLHVPYSLQSTLLGLNMPCTSGGGPGVSTQCSLSPSLPTPSTECHKVQMQGEGGGELWSDPVLWDQESSDDVKLSICFPKGRWFRKEIRLQRLPLKVCFVHVWMENSTK